MIHITSAAPGSMDQTCHKILELVQSNSVPRGSSSRSTATGAGRGAEYRLVCAGSRHACLTIPLLLPSRMQILPRFCPFFRGITRDHKHLVWPDPSYYSSTGLTRQFRSPARKTGRLRACNCQDGRPLFLPLSAPVPAVESTRLPTERARMAFIQDTSLGGDPALPMNS
jgi:hypothetical protein